MFIITIITGGFATNITINDRINVSVRGNSIISTNNADTLATPFHEIQANKSLLLMAETEELMGILSSLSPDMISSHKFTKVLNSASPIISLADMRNKLDDIPLEDVYMISELFFIVLICF